MRSKLRRPGLDVGHRHAQLDGRQGAGDRRVDVADDDHGVGPLLEHDRLEPLHDLGRLDGVRARADLEVDVGPGDAQLLEEEPRHPLVVVLAGVDQAGLDTRDGGRAPTSAARSS